MEIWRPRPSICICPKSICMLSLIRWTSCRSPVSKRRTASIAERRNEAACRGGGRYPPRTGQPFSRQVSIQLRVPEKLKAFRAIQNCRTAALGGHLDACSRCGHQAISYNSCRNRHCPKCQTQARRRWLEAREREVLPTGYFHVVFSVPHELNVFALENPRCFYDLLFAAATATALEVAATPKHLGAEIGIIGILHTWGQNLLLHPHIHCLIPAGGLSPDHTQWVRPRYSFFLPVKALSRVFRGKFIAGLKRLYRRKKLGRAGPAALLGELKRFAQFLRSLHRQDWVVYAKSALGGPRQ